MSIERDTGDGAAGAAALLARAATAMERAERRMEHATEDLFIPDDARLTERERTMLSATIAAIVDAIERDLRQGLTATRSRAVSADDGASVFDCLIASGVLRDAGLMRELVARIRLDLLDDLLPLAASEEPDTPALLSRLVASNDGMVAQAARAVMTAGARRRSLLYGGRTRGSELPVELHHKLVWWVAAAIRQTGFDAAADHALGEAALRNLASHDEGDRIEAAAMRLAATIDARPEEQAALLHRAITDRQSALFAALLATSLRIDLAAARDLVIGRDGALWVALRALALDRAAIARIGVALAREVETFADQLDAITAIDPIAARQALATYSLPADFRVAIARIESRR